MLPNLKMNYDAVSANKLTLDNNFKSPEAQANEDEKKRNGQAPKLDSIEISSQARAAMQSNFVSASQNSSSSQNAESSTQNSSSESNNEAHVENTKYQTDSLVRQGIISL